MRGDGEVVTKPGIGPSLWMVLGVVYALALVGKLNPVLGWRMLAGWFEFGPLPYTATLAVACVVLAPRRATTLLATLVVCSLFVIEWQVFQYATPFYVRNPVVWAEVGWLLGVGAITVLLTHRITDIGVMCCPKVEWFGVVETSIVAQAIAGAIAAKGFDIGGGSNPMVNCHSLGNAISALLTYALMQWLFFEGLGVVIMAYARHNEE